MYSPSIDRLIAELKKLPTVGQHTAERFVYYWLKTGKKPVTELMLSLKTLIETVKSCSVCFDFSDVSPCAVCADAKRDVKQLCVVAEPWDKAALEGTKQFNGRYFVLRGTLNPNDADSIAETKTVELLKLVGNPKSQILEVVLALNPNVAGEGTMLYLEQELKKIKPTLIITRLARGLALGSDLRYADEITLGESLKHRQKK